MAVRRWEVTSGRVSVPLANEVCKFRALGDGVWGGSTGDADTGRLVRAADRWERIEAGSAAASCDFCPSSSAQLCAKESIVKMPVAVRILHPSVPLLNASITSRNNSEHVSGLRRYGP
jgi:hypothetical protein